MSDDRKRPARGGGTGGKGGSRDAGRPRGPGKPLAGGEGAKPRFGKSRFDKSPSGGPRADGPRHDRPRPDRPGAARQEADGEAKPSSRQDGAKRAFANREGGKPGKPRPGKWERREAAAADAAGGERRPRKPFVPRDGDRPRSGSRDGDGPRPVRRERQEPKPAAVEGGERIARRLARAGVSSRRDAEAMIADGRVTLNGKVLDTPAVNVGERDRIEIDGKPIPAIERTRLFLFHKPAGVVTTSRDPEGRRTVFDVLPAGLPRLMTIGRLDINTEGLLLLTNDGGLSRVLELPATGWLRRYRVRVHGKVDLPALEGLKEGIAVDGVFYGAVEATLDREQGSNAWLTIGLREGKNREVKNILGALGLDVTRLIRVSYGPFQLGDLAEGELRELKGKYLRDQLGERLIEEAGANFDAPVLNAFSDKDGSAGAARKRDQSVEPGPERKREDKRPGGGQSGRPGGGHVGREDRREAKREDALGRLDTKKPPRGRPGGGPKAGGFGKPGGAGKPASREGRPEEKPRSRTANVWMAPGAKPMGEKKKAALEERGEGRRYAGKPRPGGQQSGKPSGKSGDKPRFSGKPGGKPSGKPSGRPAGRSGPRKPRGPG